VSKETRQKVPPKDCCPRAADSHHKRYNKRRSPRTERAVPTRHDTRQNYSIQYATIYNIKYTTIYNIRYTTIKTLQCTKQLSAIFPGGVSLPALRGTGQPRNDNILRSSDSAPLAPNHTRAYSAIRKRLGPYPEFTAKWLEWWLTRSLLNGIAGHARCRPHRMVARPDPSSSAPIFSASPQYCT